MRIIPKSATRMVARNKFLASKNAPKVLFVGGVIGVVGSTVLACRATLKLEEVLEEHVAKLDEAKGLESLMHREGTPEKYTEQDLKKDTAVIYARSTGAVLKLYAPSIALGVVSIAALTGSHKMLSTRNAGLTAALTAVQGAFYEYRSRVQDELGEDKERQIYHGVVEKERLVEGKNGPKKVKEKQFTASASPYAKIFRRGACADWSPNPDVNIMMIRSRQNYFNDRLNAKGHVMLNDVYDAFGFERTPAGAVTGWLAKDNPLCEGDGMIDFGIWADERMEKLHAYMVGAEDEILMDFNVDGVIYDKI